MANSSWKIYLDKELQDLADPINLGKLKTGETKQSKFWLYNSSVYPFDEINLDPQHPELTVIEFPGKLKEKTADVFIIEWKAVVNTKINLKPKLKITGFEVTPI